MERKLQLVFVGCIIFDGGVVSMFGCRGAKERVMQLVDSEHKDVQRHALQCVSKIMVNKWEFIR